MTTPGVMQAIRDQRIRLGLRDITVAQRAGLSIHEYCDLEQHEDEFATAVSLAKLRQVCHVLALKLRTLLGLEAVTVAEGEFSEMVRAARTARGLSHVELGDQIGFEEQTIASIESIPDFLETLPLVVVFDLERALGLERGALVREAE
jgi:transcriptional regulator with XRE-family HTH domain